MALETNFYSEIYEEEKRLIELEKHGLLNIYYLQYNNTIEFYKRKKQILSEEYNQTGNKMLGNILDILDGIILKINSLIDNYKNGQKVDMSELIYSFLISQMNNQVSNKKDNLKNIELKKQILLDLKNNYINANSEEILDDDFYYKGKIV